MKAVKGIVTHIKKPDEPLDNATTNKELRAVLRQYGYGPLLDRYPGHPIFKDEHGTVRWQRDPLMRWLADRNPSPMNDLWFAVMDGAFPMKSLKKFYRDIGYSLGGYLEAFEDDGI